MAAPSLLHRIVLRLSLTIIAATAVAYGWLWWEFETTSGKLRNRALADWAHSIADGLGQAPDGRVTLTLAPPMVKAYTGSHGEHHFSVRDGNGTVLFSGGGDTAPPPAAVPDDDEGTFYVEDPDGPGPLNYFGVAMARTIGGHRLVIQVEHRAKDYEVLMQSIAEEFFEDGGWLGLPFLLLLLGVSIATIRTSLVPLRDLSSQAESIGPAASDVRLPEAGVPSELLPLVRAINRAFDRLEDGFRAQREFTADAAHELRTPLAVLGAHIDTLPNRADALELRKDLDGMSRLVGQLLRVAQLDSLAIAADHHADLIDIAAEVASWLAPIAIKEGRSIEVTAPAVPVVVHGSREAIVHAVRNLVENALAHTPRGTAVTIAVDAATKTLSVRDHGPGIPAAQRERIFQRFARLSHRGAGAGLGLAIVKRTIETHGGAVSVADADGGGAVFALHFPAGR